jgi:hypothetical protein
MLLLNDILISIKRRYGIVEIGILSKETMWYFILWAVIFELITKGIGVESWVVDFGEVDDGDEEGFYEDVLGVLELVY